MCLAIITEVCHDAYGAGHKRNADGKIFNRFEPRLRFGPDIVRQRVDADIERLKVEYLAFLPPRQRFYVDARYGNRLARADDADAETKLPPQLLENGNDAVEVIRRRMRSDPSDDRNRTVDIVRTRREQRRVDDRRHHLGRRTASPHVIGDHVVATDDER